MTTSDDPPGELPDYGSAPHPPPLPPPPPPSTAADSVALTPVPVSPFNQKAIWSMVIGIVSLIGVCCVFGGFAGIAAIVLGAIARAEILRSGGGQAGLGMAVTGIVTGIVAELGSIVWMLVLAVA